VNPRRLYRSADDRILAGVAGGVAAYFDVDPVIVRIIWFLSVFFTGSFTFWIYIVMMIVVPLEPTEWPPQSPWAPGGGPLGYAAGFTPPAPGAAPSPEAGQDPASGAPGTTPAAGTGPSAAGVPPTAAPGGWWSNDWRWQWRQDRWQQRAQDWHQQRIDRRERERRGPGLVFGALLILVGGLLAWHQIDPNVDLSLSWPVLVIALGAILVASSLRFRDH
jgi:phage shock protein C